MKFTSLTKKEDILNSIITLWKTTEKECKENENSNPRDMMYYRGRYTAMIDLLKMVKIYEKEDTNMINVNLRNNNLWEKMTEFLNEKIEENEDTIENEKLWAKGSDTPEQASLHEGNIEELTEYNDILQYAINYGKIVCDKEIHMIWTQQLFEEYKEVLIDLEEKFGWRYYNEDYIEAVDEILVDIKNTWE